MLNKCGETQDALRVEYKYIGNSRLVRFEIGSFGNLISNANANTTSFLWCASKIQCIREALYKVGILNCNGILVCTNWRSMLFDYLWVDL